MNELCYCSGKSICEGRIFNGITDHEFFFQFSAGSAFHRCVNVGWTAAFYGGTVQDDRDHFHHR